jgi:uncharacterized SAM-binding protein YcdF (DUF218 family)
MIVGADAVRYLLSANGVILVFVITAIWTAARPESTRARRFLVGCALGFAAISVYGAQYLLGRSIAAGFKPVDASQIATGRRTAIVVLGSGGIDVEGWDGRTFSIIDREAAARVLEGARLFKLIDPAIVVSSGGNPHSDSPMRPTAETMRDALVLLGVPTERIMVQTASRTTHDEAVLVRGLLERQAVDQVVLVTSRVHMRRALGSFRAVGLRPVAAIAQEFVAARTVSDWILPSDDGLFEASANAHELIGLTYYWLRGWWR